MKRHLNTLFVTTQNAYLHKEREAISAKVAGETKLKLPIHNLDGIVCFGTVTISPFLMHHCAKNDVTISFLSEHGKFLARVHGPIAGNVLLRKEQYRRTDNPKETAKIARSFLIGKLSNSRTVLSRAKRDHKEKVDVKAIRLAEIHLASHLRHLNKENSIDELRGIEGESASVYFSIFNQLITANKKNFVFSSRNRRPPLDPVNAMLSFVYTLLVHDCRSALESVGLDPYVGFLHSDRPGRPSLALDLMEEFRSFLADRLVLSLINRQQIGLKNFKKTRSKAVLLDEGGRKIVLMAWQKRKQEGITHPFTGEKMKIGLLSHMQARLLSRYLRADLDGYPPFIWK